MDLIEFLVSDYEVKGNYLSEHHNRMWTRFSIFVSLESALFGGGFLLNMAGKVGGVSFSWLAVVGAVLSLVWVVVSWLDRKVLRIHTDHVEKAFGAIEDHYKAFPEGLKPVGTVGKIDEKGAARAQFRLLFALPLLALVAWVLLALVGVLLALVGNQFMT
jgi:hypothetical protein